MPTETAVPTQEAVDIMSLQDLYGTLIRADNSNIYLDTTMEGQTGRTIYLDDRWGTVATFASQEDIGRKPHVLMRGYFLSDGQFAVCGLFGLSEEPRLQVDKCPKG